MRRPGINRAEERPRGILDIGSNTVRLLVGRVHEGGVDVVLDQSAFVRLGLGVDATKELQPDRMQAALETIGEFASLARDHGASSIAGIATSAIRDASNGRSFAERVRKETGIDVQILSGEREAQLTFLGATLGIDLDGGVIVCDLGGGSAELIHADGHGVRWETSLPLGSGRLTERFVHHDPPEAEELQAVDAYVRSLLSGLPPASAGTLVLTGGTATHIAILAGRSGDRVSFDRQALERVASLVASTTAAEIVARFEIREERARVLPAGIAAMRAVAGHYDTPHIVITRSGIREGALIDAAR